MLWETPALITLCVFRRSVVVRLSVSPWTVAPQAPPSTGLSREKHWRGLPLPSPWDLPDPGTEPVSPLQMDSFPTEPWGKLIAISLTYLGVTIVCKFEGEFSLLSPCLLGL